MSFSGKTVFLTALVIISCLQANAQKWEKSLDKIAVQFNKGNYSRAAKFNEQLKKRSSKKLGKENAYLVDYFQNKAKIDLALGDLPMIDNELNTSIQLSDKNFGAASPEHALNLLKVADIYSRYGNQVTASVFVADAMEILTKQNKYVDRYKTSADFVNMKIAGEEGFFNKAILISSGLQADLLARIATRGVRFDPVTKKETQVSFTKSEVEQRENDYAYLLSYTGYCLGEQGNLVKADSAFSIAEQWIRKNKGKLSEGYAQYLIFRGNVENLAGKIKDSRNSFKDAYLNLKSAFKPAFYLTYEAHEKLILNYAEDNRDSKAASDFRDFDAAINKNFSKTSIYRAKADFLDLKLNNDKRNLASLERNATTILGTSFLPAGHPIRADIYKYLSDNCVQQLKYNSAMQHSELMTKNIGINLGTDAPKYHIAKLLTGILYISYSNKIAESREIYDKSFIGVISKELTPDHPYMSDFYRFASKVHQESDQYADAVTELGKASEIIKKKYGENSVRYGIDLNEIADLYINVSDFKNARISINKAGEILKNETEDEEKGYYASSMETEAKLQRIEGSYDEAISTIKRSQKLIRKSDIINYNDFNGIEILADVYMNLGKFSGTGELLLSSIERKEKLFGRDSRFLIQPLLHYGDLLIITGDYPAAEKTLNRAAVITTEVYGEKSSQFADCLVMEAKLHLALGDFEEGEKKSKTANEIQQSVFKDNNIKVSNTLALLGEISFYKGESIKTVENYFLESEAIIVKLVGSDNPLFAEDLKNLGIIFLALKNHERALGVLQQSKTIWQYTSGKRNNINTADIDVLLGDVYYMIKDYDNSISNYEEAGRLYKKFFSDTHPKYVKTLSKLSKVNYMKGDMKNAKNYIQIALNNYLQFIRDYFPSLSERGKAKFWSSIKSDFEYYNTLALNLHKQYPDMIGVLYNNSLATKSLLLNSSIKIRERILSSPDTALHQLYYNWKDKNELLTNALSMSPEELTDEGINTDKLKEEIENIEKKLSVATTGFQGTFDKKNITWENVKSSLAPTEAAVEILRFRYFNQVFTDSIVYLGLYVTSSSSSPKYFIFENGKNLESKYFSGYRNAIRFQIPDELSYEHYWLPFAKELGKSGTIYLSPDGVFNQLNLEAIPTPDGKYVLDNSNIILVNNTKDLYLHKGKSALTKDDKTATLVGNPKFYALNQTDQVQPDGKHSNIIRDLPGTASEILELKKILVTDGWNAKDYLRDSATENNLKKINNPEVFHIATHGFFTSDKPLRTELEGISLSNYEALENPLLRTGLLLSGAGDLLAATSYNYNFESGILTAYEAMNLNLDNTKLVVLSACETGLGDIEVGEGVYGLQRAFLVAGANTLIMSLFKVSDVATQKLMVKFYDKWLSSGNERQAFIEAKKEIRNEYKYPLYWGAFVMIGLDK
jgi:CHAT domain-containing protein